MRAVLKRGKKNPKPKLPPWGTLVHQNENMMCGRCFRARLVHRFLSGNVLPHQLNSKVVTAVEVQCRHTPAVVVVLPHQVLQCIATESRNVATTF